MPDFITHHLFGEALEPPLSAQRHPALFCWGLQGPDLFFYRKVITGAPYHALGGRMHEERIGQLFASLSGYCRELSGESSQMAEAYASGFVAHYSLDSAVHPYVYAQQRRQQQLNPTVNASALHGSIESDMDTDIYSKLRHCSVTAFRPAGCYTLTTEQQKSLGALYTHLLYDVYGVLMAPGEVIAAMRDTLAVQKLLFSGSQVLQRAAELLDNTKGKGSRYYSSHLKGSKPGWDSLNLGHAQWENPWTGNLCHHSVPELMELAGERYTRLVDILVRNTGGAVLAFPVEHDFSGRVVKK